MKTKTLVLIGVLIIALAAMAMPVMADGASDTAELTGKLESTATMTIANSSLNFASFTAAAAPGAAHNISPTVPAVENEGRAFADLQVSSNEASWNVYALASNSGKMKSTTQATTLTHPLNLDLAYADPADFVSSNVVLSGSPQTFLTVSAQKVATVSLPLDIGQNVENGDPADTYSTTLTLQFSAT